MSIRTRVAPKKKWSVALVERNVAIASNLLLTAGTTRVFKKVRNVYTVYQSCMEGESSTAADIEYLRKRALSVHH